MSLFILCQLVLKCHIKKKKSCILKMFSKGFEHGFTLFFQKKKVPSRRVRNARPGFGCAGLASLPACTPPAGCVRAPLPRSQNQLLACLTRGVTGASLPDPRGPGPREGRGSGKRGVIRKESAREETSFTRKTHRTETSRVR
ncbi:hypothetical protein HJG60_011153 [Phyllostomus discolor]|uniref:Uncharacterized protein n=1 Tax=Phyllostomus discolor TaxID=89673 RepID=A0A834E558_9CHIR|nr:hypothetical protein HJG60_011153 [Phyllostomus discolor]